MNNQIFYKITKLCINDTLVGIYILSSRVFTIWFLWCLVYFIFLKKYKYLSQTQVFIYLVITSYFYIYVFNFSYVSNCLNLSNINTTLQNGLLNIHPIYIYLIYGQTLFLWFHNYKLYAMRLGNISTTKLFTFLCIIITGICLGSFWASQELNWGGFWSWDPVEVISLFLFLWFITFFHNRASILLNKPINHVLIIVCFIYFIIRLGVITTIHSFVRLNTSPYFVELILLLILMVVLSNSWKYYYTYFVALQPRNNVHIIICTALIIYLYVYVYSIILFLNKNITNPMHIYFIIALLAIVVYFTVSINFISTLLNSCVILVFVLIVYRAYIYIYILVCLCVFNYVFLKNIQTHLGFLSVYFFFVLFFVNINTYNSWISWINNNISLNTHVHSITLNYGYELSYVLKKQTLLNKVKNVFTHITGFTVLTNNFVGLYMFAKNTKIYYLFLLESLHISFILIIYISIFNPLVYKYKWNKYLRIY